MRFMSTRAHSMLDLVLAPVLIALPFALGLDVHHREGWIFLAVGIAMLLLMAFTDYESGLLARRISMGTHLTIDVASGALLALSPWLFGFSHRIWVPHLLFGLIQLGTSLVTRREPLPAVRRSAISGA
jgi:hypothetical protein